MPAGPPTDDPAPPPAVTELARGRPMRAVWRNEAGGLTFRLGETEFVKWAPATSAIDLHEEAVRLAWAAAFTAVPAVRGGGEDAAGSWLVTAALGGDSAVSERFTREPALAVRGIGRGLRRLHDALPVDRCPFSWSVGTRVEWARAAGRAADLGCAPPIDRLVVCHGDACAPNTLLRDDGEPAGHVDVGALGVADRWADLAVATWSTEWNYGPGWERPLLDAYGVEPDPARTAYYRRLWSACP